MSVNIENRYNAPKVRDIDRTEETINGVSTELIEETVRAKLDHLKPQISTLTQLLNQLNQDNSGKGRGVHRPHAEPSFSRETGTSRTLPVTTIGVTGLSPDTKLCPARQKKAWNSVFFLIYKVFFKIQQENLLSLYYTSLLYYSLSWSQLVS